MGFRLKPPQWGTRSSVAPVLDAPDDVVIQPTGYHAAREGASVVPFASKANKQTEGKTASQGNQGNTASTNTPTIGNTAATAVQQPPLRSENIPPQEVSPKPAPQVRQAEQTAPPTPALENLPLLSHKITKVNALKKVIDFNDKLVLARIEDYANIHGRGGDGHNGNSTIGIVLCDYTKGTGNKSVTVSFNLDVDEVDTLCTAGKLAKCGQLTEVVTDNRTPVEKSLVLVNSWARIPAADDGTRAISRQDLAQLRALLEEAVKPPVIVSTFKPVSREKNNPYKKKDSPDGYVPVSSIDIKHCPTRPDGSVSNYPWYIAIKNFEAPLNVSANGASTHSSSKARNVTSAFINLSEDDFAKAMNRLVHFIFAWEHQAAEQIKTAKKIQVKRKQLAANNTQK